LSSQTLTHAAGIIRRHRKKIGSCWRKLNPGRQALLVLAYLRKGDTFAELAAGLGAVTAILGATHGPSAGRSRPAAAASGRPWSCTGTA